MAKKKQKIMYATYRMRGLAPTFQRRRAIPCKTEEELTATLMALCSYAAVMDVRANRCGHLPKGTEIIDQTDLH